MSVLVIGATGFLGGGAARALREAGHEVAGSARSATARERLSAAGYGAVAVGVDDPAGMARAASESDGVVYAVQLSQADAEKVESTALRAMFDALAGSGKPFVYTSGVWYYGPTSDRVDEETPPNPPPAGLARPRIERIVLDAAQRGVRAIVVRPGDVFGEGRGLPAMFVQSARERGKARTFGDGSNRWPVVHVDDLGALYALAFAKASPGDVYNATDETSFTQLQIAQAASRGAGAGGATEAWPLEEARAAMGAWVDALAMDQRVTSVRARSRLGWNPKAPTILDDIEHGSYAT